MDDSRTDLRVRPSCKGKGISLLSGSSTTNHLESVYGIFEVYFTLGTYGHLNLYNWMCIPPLPKCLTPPGTRKCTHSVQDVGRSP